MAKKTTAKTTEGPRKALERVAEQLGKSRNLRNGRVVLHLSGTDYCLDCSDGRAKVVAGSGGDSAPLVEISGDAATIQAILDGRKDALKQFAAGGLRIRGDLRYFSDKALELGILDTPL
jgi:hypothetical protein